MHNMACVVETHVCDAILNKLSVDFDGYSAGDNHYYVIFSAYYTQNKNG